MPKKKPLSVNTDAAAEQENRNRSFNISKTGTFIHEGEGVRISMRDGMKVDEAAYGASAPVNRQLLRSFDEIRMLEHLGHGGGGVVHKAEHVPTGGVIAVKTINVMDADKRHQLMRELKTLYKASSPFIVEFKGAFYDDMHCYIVLEYMDGGSLQDVLRKAGPIPEEVLSDITRQIAHGMTYLHQTHQIHRDIKPGNILISRRGDVKLTDFGVTGELSKDAEALGTFVGTARYMAPEQLSGKSYSYAADIWALGICLMEFTTGEHPYARYNCKSQMELLLALQSEPLPELPSGSFSRELRDFTSQCLKMEAADRATVTALLEHPFVSSTSAPGGVAAWVNEKLDAYSSRRAKVSPAKPMLAAPMPSPLPSPMPIPSPLQSPQPGETGWTHGMAMSYHQGDLTSSPQAAALAAQRMALQIGQQQQQQEQGGGGGAPPIYGSPSVRPPLPSDGTAVRPRNGRPPRRRSSGAGGGGAGAGSGSSGGVGGGGGTLAPPGISVVPSNVGSPPPPHRSPGGGGGAGGANMASPAAASDDMRHRPANRSRLATFRRQQQHSGQGTHHATMSAQDAMAAAAYASATGVSLGQRGPTPPLPSADADYAAAAWAAAGRGDTAGAAGRDAEQLQAELARMTAQLNALNAADDDSLGSPAGR